MPAPIRRVLALITALAVAILGSALLPAAVATAAGSGQSDRPAASGRSPGEEPEKNKQTPDRTTSPQSRKPTDRARTSQSDGAPAEKSPAEKTRTDTSGSARTPSAPATQPAPSRSSAAQTSERPEPAAEKAGIAGDKSRVPGNNGTVKIEDVESYDGTPNNVPHVGCDFQVEWFGFDEGGDIVSDVGFLSHAPTKGQGPAPYDPESVDVGGDGQSGAGTESGWDGAQPYSLDFTGDPHPQQGYHVKLTTTTEYSQGSDRKHKVFWVESCEETDEEETDEEETDEDETDEDETDEDETDEDETDDVEKDVEGPGDDTEVGGVQLQVQPPVAQRSVPSINAPTADVPTAVAAGLGEDVASLKRSYLPLALVLLGLATFVAALYRRVRA